MKFKKILVISMRQIGDTLVTTPLISAVKNKWPNAQVDFLGYENSLSMLSGNPDLHQIIGTKPRPKLKDYLKYFFCLFRKYDLAVITQPSDRSYMYGLIAAKKRIGVIPNDSKTAWWKKKITMHNVEVDYFHQHVVTEKLRLLEPFCSETELFEHSISVKPPKASDVPIEISSQIQQPYIVVHPTPLTAYKRWSVQNWVRLIEALSKNYQIVLSGAPIDQDRKLNKSIIDLLTVTAKRQILNLDGQLKLDELGALLRKAKLYIGVDTSVTHLAAACDVPTIALFGATPPTNFGPWPNGFTGKQPYEIKARKQKVQNVTILQGPGNCVPCRKQGCEDKADSRSDCLINLAVTDVIEAARSYEICC